MILAFHLASLQIPGFGIMQTVLSSSLLSDLLLAHRYWLLPWRLLLEDLARHICRKNPCLHRGAGSSARDLEAGLATTSCQKVWSHSSSIPRQKPGHFSCSAACGAFPIDASLTNFLHVETWAVFPDNAGCCTHKRRGAPKNAPVWSWTLWLGDPLLHFPQSVDPSLRGKSISGYLPRKVEIEAGLESQTFVLLDIAHYTSKLRRVCMTVRVGTP
jgi:hypothetical protein